MKTRRFLIVAVAIVFLSLATGISHANPGISVTVVPVDPFINFSGDSAMYTVSVESITTEDENVKLTVSGDPDVGFDWISKEFVLVAGDTASFGLEVTYSGSSPGDFTFTVSGEAWPTWLTYEEAVDMGLIETSSFIDYVHVLPQSVIPEVPIGTIVASGSIIAAIGAYITVPRFRKKDNHA